MRLLYACAAVALTASSALAQSHYADSTGGYLALTNLSVGSGGQRTLDGAIGYRLGGGVDAGLRLGYAQFGSGRGLRVGPVAGISRPLGLGATGRLEGTLQYASSSADIPAYDVQGTFYDASRYATRGLSQDVTATVSRPLRLVGSLRLRPTLGAYATASQLLTADVPAQFESRLNRSSGSAGLHVEIPLTFRLFGQDVAFTPAGRLPLVGDRFYGPNSIGPVYAGGGLRLNF